MSSRRVTQDSDGYRRIELDGDLHIEPEISAGRWDEPVLSFSLERTTAAGTFEVTKITVRLPRSSVTRLLSQIRKLHDRERKAINADIFEITKP